MNTERGADVGEDLEAEEKTVVLKGRRQCLRKDERRDGQGKGFFLWGGGHPSTSYLRTPLGGWATQINAREEKKKENSQQRIDTRCCG
jgi:hypothetical protein